MAAKIDEVLATGELKRLSAMQDNERMQAQPR